MSTLADISNINNDNVIIVSKIINLTHTFSNNIIFSWMPRGHYRITDNERADKLVKEKANNRNQQTLWNLNSKILKQYYIQLFQKTNGKTNGQKWTRN